MENQSNENHHLRLENIYGYSDTTALCSSKPSSPKGREKKEDREDS